jgi:hypothetical protein
MQQLYGVFSSRVQVRILCGTFGSNRKDVKYVQKFGRINTCKVIA